MATVRIMWVGQGASTLPEDRFINTFHFHDPSTDYSAVVEDLLDAVRDFYETTTSGGNTLSAHISAYCLRAAQLLAYDLTEPPIRTPTVRDITLDAAVGTGLPEEVAACLSLRGDPPNTPRRRGRLYIGPLANNASGTIEGGSTSGKSSPANASAGQLVQCMIASAQALVAASALVGCPWSIRSTTPTENFVEITNGYVDDAFDTIRRRGPKTTLRNEWP